jgi:hypothetical protein
MPSPGNRGYDDVTMTTTCATVRRVLAAVWRSARQRPVSQTPLAHRINADRVRESGIVPAEKNEDTSRRPRQPAARYRRAVRAGGRAATSRWRASGTITADESTLAA